MTGSQWFFTYRQTARKVNKNSTKFFIGCGQAHPRLHTIGEGAQRLLKSYSFTENSIEWKIKWKKRVPMHFSFTIYHCKCSCWIRLLHLLISWKFTRSLLFFLCMLGDAQMRKVLKKNGIFGSAEIGVK